MGPRNDTGAYAPHFTDFLKWALGEQLKEGTPDEHGQGCKAKDGRLVGFRTPLWKLVRLVKGRRPEWTAEYAWRRVDSQVRRNLGGWEKWLPDWDGVEDDLEASFVRGWKKCKRPGLESAPEEAARLVKVAPFPVATQRKTRLKGYENFLCFCGYMVALAARTEDGMVGLSQRNVGKALGGIRPNTIGTWIEWAKEDGYLTLAKEATASKNPHAARAARYKVAKQLVKGAWNMLREVRMPRVLDLNKRPE